MENFTEYFKNIGPFITFLGASISAGVALYTWRGNAAAKFREAINPEIAVRFNGYSLAQALLGASAGNGQTIEGAYFKHRRAFREFRRFLGPVGRRKIDKAWNEYTGGNDDAPDFLKMYCLAEQSPGSELSEKQKLLKARLEKLHDISTIWY